MIVKMCETAEGSMRGEGECNECRVLLLECGVNISGVHAIMCSSLTSSLSFLFLTIAFLILTSFSNGPNMVDSPQADR